MASDRDFVLYVAEQIGLGSRLTYRKMFGEYALYLDERSSPSSAITASSSNLHRRPRRSLRICRKPRRIPAPRIIRWPTNCWTMPTNSADS